jgi:uracil-DNA glycosylase
MKRKLIEDSINYLKHVQKNGNLKVPAELIKHFEIEIPKESRTVEESVYEKIISNHKEEFKERIMTDSVIRDSGMMSLLQEEWMDSGNMNGLDEKINKCTKCSLHSTRKNFVFGTGNHGARLMLIGEAPGADEDEQGKPFVGRAGKLLTDILKAINFEREDVFICNILKCRPPGNRNPMPEEIAKCEPYLLKQIELIKPDFILCLGAYAGQTMLRTKEPLGKMRGKFFNFEYQGHAAKLMVTFHPAALLRNPNWKRPVWEDVKLLRSEYDKEKEK